MYWYQDEFVCFVNEYPIDGIDIHNHQIDLDMGYITLSFDLLDIINI